MCGIIGAYCANPGACSTILLAGLKYMQNRGYYSAGVFTITDNGCTYSPLLHNYASTPTSTALERLGERMSAHDTARVGFGHTRWATHGAKTDANSHPHRCANGLFTLVHNGILENYKPLKKMLTDDGRVFRSETDTEVICNLISHFYLQITTKEERTIADVRAAINAAQAASYTHLPLPTTYSVYIDVLAVA